MKIAQVVPIWESVPPLKYGGTQRIAYTVTEGLIKAGHQVTLFASGDSKTSAELISVYPRALYRDNISWENHLYPALNIISAFDQESEFDIIHCHIDRHTEYLAFALAKYLKKPIVFTLHFALPFSPDRADRKAFLERFRSLNYISISNSQREPLPDLNYIATVYNGIDLLEIDFHQNPGKDLIWLGRISQSKGAKEAIEIALKSGHNLIMAGKLDELNKADMEYYQNEVKPKIDGKQIKYLGEVDAEGKNTLFKNGLALLNPIQWSEPFGLVPVEAMAAGLPVIANDRGAMPELIKHGKTGYLVKTVDEAVIALKSIAEIDRAACRKHVQDHFTDSRMIDDYIKVYQKVCQNKD